jgi:signal transduction histidine kinase
MRRGWISRRSSILIWPERLVGDVSRLRQILFNLAGNAIKFTTEGGVLIEARRGQGGEGLELVVRDTGVGVPEHAKGETVRGVQPGERGRCAA